MDFYANYTKEANDLRDKIVNAIREVLTQDKGYQVGDILHVGANEIEIMYDRILVDETHTDHLRIEELLNVLRNCYHVIPKY